MLLADVRRMDSEGWSRLVSTFGPIVYRWCRTSGVSESDAPDIVQEVFASVARGIAGFEREKREGSFRSWLAAITRNKVRDHFRRRAKSGQAEGGTEALLRLQEHAESLDSTICADAAESPVVRRVLEQVRAEFEESTWQAFWLAVIDNKSTAEVAATVGISAASVYQAKSRVLRRLRQNLSQLPE
ncbi:MAG: sigma-70 family RNA polymerase sigma factor [Planctomycetes bacterium]|nr:sigma-70 family RNA polymerase sigma factor [Planctomycetota bacterium]